MKIPERGLDRDALFARMEAYRQDDMPWRDGRTWAYIYDPGPEAEEVVKRAYSMYLGENGLDPTVFPSTLRLENEIVAMGRSHLGGDDEVVGSFTSGGTESCLLAVKTARDRARALHPEIDAPEMVLPSTAHAAFHKAGHYFGVKPVTTDIDPVTFRADPEAMRRAITPRTVLLVASAVSYAHGVVDPIPEIGRIALERDVLLHVDGCIGAFLLPYFRRLGGRFPEFDFRVPGVTSMSMDLHKYAFAAKGASLILHRNKSLRRHQIYTCADWTGYSIVNPTVQSTKSAGPLAGAWAALNFIGDDGYLEMARKMKDATERVCAGIAAIPGLRVLGRPDMNLVAFTSDDVSVFHVIDEMKLCRWYVQPQLAYGSSKENIHLSINPAAHRWVDDFLADLRICVERAAALPSGEIAARVREAVERLDPARFDEATFFQLIELAGLAGTALPGRMAPINEIMNSLPVAFREKVLTEYANQLFHPASGL